MAYVQRFLARSWVGDEMIVANKAENTMLEMNAMACQSVCRSQSE